MSDWKRRLDEQEERARAAKYQREKEEAERKKEARESAEWSKAASLAMPIGTAAIHR